MCIVTTAKYIYLLHRKSKPCDNIDLQEGFNNPGLAQTIRIQDMFMQSRKEMSQTSVIHIAKLTNVWTSCVCELLNPKTLKRQNYFI